MMPQRPLARSAVIVALVGLVGGGCDLVRPDPLPERGDEWLVARIKQTMRGESHPSGACRRRTFYRDKDGDGFGDQKHSVQACRAPAGYVDNAKDCYDDNAQVHPGQTGFFYKDRGDGSFDYDCDGQAKRRIVDRAFCREKEDGASCSYASGWLQHKIPRCGEPGRWKWYECAQVLIRPDVASGMVGAVSGQGAGSPSAVGVPSAASSGSDDVMGTHAGSKSASSGQGSGPAASGLSPQDFRSRSYCRGKEMPWKKRQLCR